MPCESLFASQSAEYKKSVLLKKPTLKVAIEASNDPIWYKYVGENGLIVSVSSYQPSGKSSEVYEKAGFNCNNIVKLIRKTARFLLLVSISHFSSSSWILLPNTSKLIVSLFPRMISRNYMRL